MYNELFGNSPGSPGSPVNRPSPTISRTRRSGTRLPGNTRLASAVPSRVSRQRTHTVKHIMKRINVQKIADMIKEHRNIQLRTLHFTLLIENKRTVYIRFLSHRKECITLEYVPSERTMELESYYYNTKKIECIGFSHDWFFNVFLKPLCEKLNVERITLVDGSLKSFKMCDVTSGIFAYAKGKTFYQRYGFENKKFTDFIENTRELTMREYMEQVGTKIKINVTEFQDLLDLYDLNEVKMRDLCKFLIDECNETNRFSLEHSRILMEFIEKFISFSDTSSTWVYIV
jgi:hypothetical protein